MSKKLKSQNTKALAAKERKLQAQEMEMERKKKEIEDSYWEESDKTVLKKTQREEERKKRIQKKQEHNIKKFEDKITLEKEVEHIKTKTANIKITRDTIMAQLETPTKTVDKKLTPLPPLVENLNRQDVEVIDAHSITEAIRALKSPETKVDMHPERRMKLAYLAYVEDNLPILKEQNPTLRLSQLKEMLKKQWKMSREHAIQ